MKRFSLRRISFPKPVCKDPDHVFISCVVYFCYCCSVARLCPTLCNPVDCSMPGLPVHTVLGFLAARMLKWFAISSSSGPCFVRTLHYDLSLLEVWQGMAHSLNQLCKPFHHKKAVIHEGDKGLRKTLMI